MFVFVWFIGSAKCFVTNVQINVAKKMSDALDTLNFFVTLA